MSMSYVQSISNWASVHMLNYILYNLNYYVHDYQL